MLKMIKNTLVVFLVSTSFFSVPVTAEETTKDSTNHSVSVPLAAPEIVTGSVHYVSEDGHLLLPALDVSINSGSKFNWPIPAVIKGYSVDYSKSTLLIKASTRTQETSLQDFMSSMGLNSIEETILFLNSQVANYLAAESATLTYVYTQTYEQAEHVIVRYIDKQGNQLHEPLLIDGYIGDSYTADTDLYKLKLDGYTLDELQLPQNAVGKLSDLPQEVIYVYQPIEQFEYELAVPYAPASIKNLTLTVPLPQQYAEHDWSFHLSASENFFDYKQESHTIHINSFTYRSETTAGQATIDFGWVNFIQSASGINNLGFTMNVSYTEKISQQVINVRYHIKFINSSVAIHYVDETGNPLHDAQVIEGSIGDDYDVSGTAYQYSIDGYTLDTAQLPVNSIGKMTANPQTITYVYQKNPEKAADITVKYLDTFGNEIYASQTISGNLGEIYDVSTLQYKPIIDGYTLLENQLPENAVGLFSTTAQTVVYAYQKEPEAVGTVRIFYLDEAGQRLAEPDEFTGVLNTYYTITPKKITGYKVKTIQGEEAGTFTSEDQQVIYTYEKEKISQQPEPTSDSSAEIPSANTSTNAKDAKELAQTSNSKQATATNSETSQLSSAMNKQNQLPRTNTYEPVWYLIIGGGFLLLVGYVILKRRIDYK